MQTAKSWVNRGSIVVGEGEEPVVGCDPGFQVFPACQALGHICQRWRHGRGLITPRDELAAFRLRALSAAVRSSMAAPSAPSNQRNREGSVQQMARASPFGRQVSRRRPPGRSYWLGLDIMDECNLEMSGQRPASVT